MYNKNHGNVISYPAVSQVEGHGFELEFALLSLSEFMYEI